VEGIEQKGSETGLSLAQRDQQKAIVVVGVQTDQTAASARS